MLYCLRYLVALSRGVMGCPLLPPEAARFLLFPPPGYGRMWAKGGEIVSIVLNLVSRNRSWIMSDGRAIGANQSENIQKFRVIHPLLCIGFTGTLEYARAVLDAFSKAVPPNEILSIEPSSDLICQISATLMKKTHTRAQFLVTGISKEGCLGTITISSDNTRKYLLPSAESLSFAQLGNPFHLDFGKYLSKHRIGATDLDTMIEKSLAHMVQDISTVDETVNRNTYFHVLRLPKKTRIPFLFE